MYNTQDMMKKEKQLTVTKPQVHEKFNAYQCGYGAQGKNKKQRHKADRILNKKMCKEEW